MADALTQLGFASWLSVLIASIIKSNPHSRGRFSWHDVPDVV